MQIKLCALTNNKKILISKRKCIFNNLRKGIKSNRYNNLISSFFIRYKTLKRLKAKILKHVRILSKMLSFANKFFTHIFGCIDLLINRFL